jgi:hypothetical protein
VSKFGSLAVICAENPRAFSGTHHALAEGALVPEELLESDYDGPSRLPWHVRRPSSSARFFCIFWSSLVESEAGAGETRPSRWLAISSRSAPRLERRGTQRG